MYDDDRVQLKFGKNDDEIVVAVTFTATGITCSKSTNGGASFTQVWSITA